MFSEKCRILAKNPSPEVKRRIEQLLDGLRLTGGAHELRMFRIIDVLEHMGTPDAREFLELIAEGRYGPPFVAPAQEALLRSARRPG